VGWMRKSEDQSEFVLDLSTSMCLKAWIVEVELTVENLIERMPSGCNSQGNFSNNALEELKDNESALFSVQEHYLCG